MAHQLGSGAHKWERGTMAMRPWHADMPEPKFSLRFWLREQLNVVRREAAEQLYRLGDYIGG